MHEKSRLLSLKKVIITTILFELDNTYYAYAPALDIVGYGKDESEASESFKISAEEFFNYTEKKGTLRSELKRLGWEIHNNKPKTPDFVASLQRMQSSPKSTTFNNDIFAKTLTSTIPFSIPDRAFIQK